MPWNLNEIVHWWIEFGFWFVIVNIVYGNLKSENVQDYAPNLQRIVRSWIRILESLSCLLLLGIILLDNDILHCLLCYTLYFFYTIIQKRCFQQDQYRWIRIKTECQQRRWMFLCCEFRDWEPERPPHRWGRATQGDKEQAVHQRHTDKKEKKIFLLIYKEIQMGSAAKSYMRKRFIIYEEMHKYLTICEETVSYILLCNWSLLNFLICEEKLIFFLINTGANWSRWGKWSIIDTESE